MSLLASVSGCVTTGVGGGSNVTAGTYSYLTRELEVIYGIPLADVWPRALAAVESGEAGRRVSARPQSEWVAGTGRLDFHHVGAERRQQHAGVRSGDEGGDLDDAHAGEWSSYRGHVERFSMPTDDTLYEPMSLSPGGRGNT